MWSLQFDLTRFAPQFPISFDMLQLQGNSHIKIIRRYAWSVPWIQWIGKIVQIEGAAEVEWRGLFTMLTFWINLNDNFERHLTQSKCTYDGKALCRKVAEEGEEMVGTKSFTKITAEELHEMMSRKTDLIIIDTLPKELFEKRHLPGAQNACVFQVVFPSEVEAIVPNRDQEVVLYGSSSVSHDSVTAAVKLVRLGYSKVFALTGGLAAWREAGYPLAGNDPDSADDGDRLILDDRSYTVDIEQSIIEWTGRNPNTRHYGTLRLSRGNITILQGTLNGTFEIDVHSLKNLSLEGNEWQPLLIAHLKSDDFFFTEKFPTTRFTIDSARKISESLSAPNFEVEGTLELRGVRNKVKFLATVSNLPDSAITTEAHFDFDRTQWKIIYGSNRYFEHLGMHLVFDPISIGLHIVAR